MTATTWACPVNPDWCDNTGCQGDECTGHPLDAVPATLDPGYAALTGDGMEFPYVSIRRVLVDGTLGVDLTVNQPSYRIQPHKDGPWEWVASHWAGAPMTPHQARTLRDQLTEILGE